MSNLKTYDYQCQECQVYFIELSTYEDKDNNKKCLACSAESSKRVYRTPPNVRTEKLSASFLDKTSAGGGRPDKGFEDLKTAAELRVKAMNMKEGEDKNAIKKEIKDRESI